MIVDSHAHLCWESFDSDRDAVIERARAAGVSRIVVVGTNVESSQACRTLCDSHEALAWTAGVHPSDAEAVDADVRAQIEQLCREEGCVAVGETGLDWFKKYAPRAAQLSAFDWQLQLALELDKPVIIHCREAHEDTSRMVSATSGLRGVLHCFTMGPDELAPYLEAGLCISFSGVVTYKSNDANREAARAVPLDRLLIETDSPWLPPVPHRGARNEPAHVVHVLECIARERGMDPAELGQITRENSERLFFR
ncbi:MAG: TatD DNase family protein [Planctomycetota bacterium]|jgi:TatD DNase family protein